MKRRLAWGLFGTLVALLARLAAAEPAPRGSLLIIGGGLRPDNRAVVEKFIAGAGGREACRLVVFPSASKSDRPAREFSALLASYGVPPGQVTILDLMPENAATQAESPQLIEQIRQATGAFFAGGDQLRIIRSLVKPDGTPTGALTALEAMWRRGGIIGGSSAGAAVQSARMLRVSGLPDEWLDPGMDALDFGVSKHAGRRGLMVASGLGFFQAGIIDQHFSQFRGRLGRLSRALVHERVQFGFGIDENTALAVSPDGAVEVVGAGSVTILDAGDATIVDGPLGCQLRGLRLSWLQTGDRFDPATGTAIVRPEKKIVVAGTEDYVGNHLITDIDGPAAVPYAICLGLAENASRRQQGITLQYNRHFAHGYRFTFTETDRTHVHAGYVDHYYSYAMVDLQFDIEPVLADLNTPQAGLPIDLDSAAARPLVEGLWYRGILLADGQRRLRPRAPMERGELAAALAQSVHLARLRAAPPAISDVAESAVDYEDVIHVVAAGLMTLDAHGRFRPKETVTRLEAARALVSLAKLLTVDLPPGEAAPMADAAEIPPDERPVAVAAIGAGLIPTEEGRFRPAGTIPREQVALAIGQLVGFEWSHAPTAASPGK